MRISASKNNKIYIKFLGATTQCMQDYVKPSLKHNPDLVILNCGTNDLRAEKSVEDIADVILGLGKRIKSTDNDVIISSVVHRNDASN